MSNLLLMGVGEEKLAATVAGGNTHSIDLELSSSQSLSRADEAAYDLSGDVTCEAWIKFESLSTTADMVIFGKGTQAGGDGTANYNLTWRPLLVAGSDQLNANFRRTGDNNAISYAWTPTAGVWYHVAVTRKTSDGETIIYLNGSAVQTTANTAGSLVNNASPFIIGVSDGGSNYFDGLIDEVRLWSTVRTPTEIADNYNVELVGNETGLVAYYKLNDSLLDETSNNLDLTNNGSATFSTDKPF